MTRIIISLVSLLAVFSTTSLAEPTEDYDPRYPIIRFATGEIKPYQMKDESGGVSGIAIPIIECSMRKLGKGFTIDLLPWARAQKNVEMGHHDAFFVASKNKNRDNFASASKSIFEGTRSWILHKDSSDDPLSADFKTNKRVGAVFGTNMHKKLELTYQSVVTKKDELSLINLLNAGRIDAVLMTNAMFDYLIEKHDKDANQFRLVNASQHPLGVYFGKKFLEQQPGFLKQFNRALEDCRA